MQKRKKIGSMEELKKLKRERLNEIIGVTHKGKELVQ